MSRPKPLAARKTTVFLVDDHPLLREGLRSLIDQEADLTVCGQAGSAAEALPAIARAQPQVIIADISMPGRDGLELIKDLKARDRHAVVLALSMHDEALYAERVLRAGARGYVMKNAPATELLQAIRRVRAGEFVLGAQVIGQMAARTAAGTRPGASSPLECLTNRELEIFRLLGHGRLRREVIRQLHLSGKTIDAHQANMGKKLGVRTAAQLRKLAVEFLLTEITGNFHAHSSRPTPRDLP